MKKQLRTYSMELKLEAVKRYLEDRESYRAIARDLNISCWKSVGRWVKHYEREGVEGLKEKRGTTRKDPKGQTRPLNLEEENKELRAENEYLKKCLGFERG